MNRPALLSIIIVAYRSREEIGDCLASLPRGSEGGMVEVIVIDNSPGDGTDAIVRRRFPWMRYFAMGTNVGFGRANNLGFRESSGAIVLFLNPDTVANAGALEHCVRRLQTEPEIGMISPKLVQVDGRMDAACRRSIPTIWDGFCRASGLAAAFPRSAWFSGYNLTHLPEDGTYDVGAINGAFMMARREVLESVAEPLENSPEGTKRKGVLRSTSSASSCESNRVGRIFDERFFMYGDDLDLCIRVARAGYRIVYDGRAQVTHLKGMSVARDYDRMARAIFDANRDVYLKHFNPRGSRLVAWKYRLAFGAWRMVALFRARRRGHRRVRPL